MKARLLTLLAAIAVLMSSCSKDKDKDYDVFDVVPDDVDIVAVLDADALTKIYGIDIKGDEVKLSKDGPIDLIPAEVQETIAKIYKALDMSRIVMFAKVDSDPSVNVVARVTDADMLTGLLTDAGAEKSEGGYRFSSFMCVYIKDGLAWLTNGDSKAIEATIKKASDNGFFSGKIAGVQKPDGIATFYIHGSAVSEIISNYTKYLDEPSQRLMLSAAADYIENKWGIITAQATEDECITRIMACDSEGELIEVPFLKKIDPKILASVPSDVNILMAVAFNDEALSLLRTLMDESQVKNLLSYDIANNLDNIVNDLEGTAFVGCEASPKNASLLYVSEDLDTPICIGLKLKPQAVATVIPALADLMRGSLDESKVTVTDRTIEVVSEGQRLFFRLQGDYLVLSNMPTYDVPNTRFKNLVDSHLMAFGMTCTPDLVCAFLNSDTDFSMDIDAYLDSTSLTLKVKYSKPIHEVIADLISSASNPDYFGFQDFDSDDYDADLVEMEAPRYDYY